MKHVTMSTELRILEAASKKKSGAQRVAIYARISTAKQHTIDEQIAQARQRCTERGWVVKYILKDEALSGGDATRPAFQRLLDLAEQGLIDVVVIWKIDRLARSLAHAAAVEEILREQGVAVHSCTEPIDTTTPVGRFVFGNLANAAQLELDLIKERIRMGMYRCAREGRWTRPSVPLGYRKTKNHHLRIHPQEADLVRHIFRTYLQAGSDAETAHHLNQTGQLHRGQRWTASAVAMVLTNPLYTGTLTASGFTQNLPRLRVIDEELEAAVKRARQQKLRDGKRSSPSLREAAIESVFTQYLEGLQTLTEAGGC